MSPFWNKRVYWCILGRSYNLFSVNQMCFSRADVQTCTFGPLHGPTSTSCTLPDLRLQSLYPPKIFSFMIFCFSTFGVIVRRAPDSLVVWPMHYLDELVALQHLPWRRSCEWTLSGHQISHSAALLLSWGEVCTKDRNDPKSGFVSPNLSTRFCKN